MSITTRVTWRQKQSVAQRNAAFGGQVDPLVIKRLHANTTFAQANGLDCKIKWEPSIWKTLILLNTFLKHSKQFAGISLSSVAWIYVAFISQAWWFFRSFAISCNLCERTLGETSFIDCLNKLIIFSFSAYPNKYVLII